MATSPVLHPAVRERREPRMSATALAEYLILQPDGQETILHDSRFSRPPIVTANGDAMRALRAYNWNPRRDTTALDRVKKALTDRAAVPDVKPKTRDEALRCIEAINLFERHENALGMRSMALSEPPRIRGNRYRGGHRLDLPRICGERWRRTRRRWHLARRQGPRP